MRIAPTAALVAAALCLAGVRVPAQVGPDLTTVRMALYEYDHALPLNPELKPMPESNERQAALRSRYHLAYDSAHSQRVTAIYSVPKRFDPPYPAVVLLAGSGGHKDTDYIRICADLMSSLGYATISIDAQYHGERSRTGHTGDFHLINSAENRDAWIQTVIDLRRAVDFLQSQREVDGAHIGYLGFSQGGIAGGTFLGVEPRIQAACLVVAGGGLVNWSHTIGLWKPELARDIEVNAALTDPVYFVGRFAPHPLLMLAAKKDEMIPKSATDALFTAAGEPKRLVWMEGGHASPTAAFTAVPLIRQFFQQHLGTRQPRSAP